MLQKVAAVLPNPKSGVLVDLKVLQVNRVISSVFRYLQHDPQRMLQVKIVLLQIVHILLQIKGDVLQIERDGSP